MWTRTRTTQNCAMFCPRDQTAQAVVEDAEADRSDQSQKTGAGASVNPSSSIHLHLYIFDFLTIPLPNTALLYTDGLTTCTSRSL